MTYLVQDGVVLSRAPEGPLATYIGSFAKSLREQGYTLDSTHRQALLAACFSQWLKRQGVALRSITSDHRRQYLRYRTRRVRLCRGDAAALRHLLDFLRHERVIPTEKKVSAHPLTSAERCAQAYEQHLREARGLVALASWIGPLRQFILAHPL